ncbi:MAG: type IV secretion system protein VirB11 [Candidatus Nanoclepta minutus]|uniref:Type IV secretion system protein VirB11 n=1 Tax=Candidatus Nanoclepta minutus TaxID=1940235 RepID=A0A397WNI6_9ARCH|nr:MAG: type IV secretion system protein VirB11 [Candidatus Nanoclepta minutus]
MEDFIDLIIRRLAEKEKRKFIIRKKLNKLRGKEKKEAIEVKPVENLSNKQLYYPPQAIVPVFPTIQNLTISTVIPKKKKKKKRVKGAFPLSSIKERGISDEEKLKFFLYLYGKGGKDVEMEYVVTKEEIDGRIYEMAKARIDWDPENREFIYSVIEPRLEEKEREIVSLTLKEIERKIDIPYLEVRDKEFVRNYIIKKSREIWKLRRINVRKEAEPYILYYILRDTIGYGKIDVLMRDIYIEDISCNGVNIPIFIFHRNPLIGEIKTNITFEDEEELDNFVIKLAIRTGRYISIASPLLDAALPDGSRVQITYGKEISRKGSSFTVRKFTQDPFTPIDLLNYGTADFRILAYLWTLIEEEKSVLVAGGTASGKTSLLNAISLFIKPEKKIVSIEDTPELMLPHPNWLQEVARPGFGPQRYGEVTLYDLLKASLRQRPDYIIVGEVRGQEAFILFQAMATGHAGMGTIHAESFEGLVDRLISPPISLPPFLIEILDAVVFLRRARYKGKYVRRIDKIYEIIRYDHKRAKVLKTMVSSWDPKTDGFVLYDSYKLKKIAEFHNMTFEELKANLDFKIKVLEYLYNNRIRNYRRIAEYLRLYYYSPEELAKIIGFK